MYKKFRKFVARTRNKTFASGEVIYKKLDKTVFGRKRVKELEKLRETLNEHVENDDLTEVLKCMVRLNELKRKGSLASGKYITEFLENKEKHEKLKNVTEKLHALFPSNAYITYLYTYAIAKLGDPLKANKVLLVALNRLKVDNVSLSTHANREKVSLIKNWRILDAEARNNMEWLINEDGEVGNYKNFKFLPDFSSGNSLNFQVHMLYLEPLLQGKCEKEFLEASEHMYRRARNLSQRLRVINSIMRTGIRRLPNYHAPYELAKKLYQQSIPEITELLDKYENGRINNNKGLLASMKVLRSAYREVLSLKSFEDIAARLRAVIIKIAYHKHGSSTRYLAALALIEADPVNNLKISRKIMKMISSSPKGEQHIADYLNWACISQSYGLAQRFYNQYPTRVRRKKTVLIYTKILQRVGKFKEAAVLAAEMHAVMLSSPYTLCVYSSWSLIRRIGELDFSAETASIFNQVPQPKEPKGVIFTTFRSMEQVRRAPLVVFLELKKMGYAVLPLSKGLLPIQRTGIAEIDQFAGCLTLDRELSLKSRESFDLPETLEYEVEEKILKWGKCDLSHALWEEAAINRRMYNVDFSCPALKKYLGNAVKWTNLSGMVMTNIQSAMAEMNLNCGFIINFNHRLPDLLFRLYCQHYGDPKSFYCLHFANGYQNYFTNFSTNISSKGVIRNMTEHWETRAASVPVRSMFKKYYEANKHKKDEMIEQVIGNTKVKRSTEGSGLSDEAEQALEKILAWKENGGKVACAFGKVVCDSSVPYDGGPAHKDMKDWLNHTIESAKDSNTLLLLKPHPHELKESIACFLNEEFTDIIEQELPDNVMLLGHRWFDINILTKFLDLGLIYNGTTCVELGVIGIPCVLGSYFAPIDYPIGHVTPSSREEYREYVRFEKHADVDDDFIAKSACWLHCMSGDQVTLNYRYHARSITNKVLYPSWWFKEDIEKYFKEGDEDVRSLAMMAINE